MSDVRDLFGFGQAEVDAPYTKGSATSYEAAKDISRDASTLRQQVYRHIQAQGPKGTTDDAAEAVLGMKHTTYTARRGELVKKGLVADSGRTGKTRSGRKAVLWVAATGENREELEETARLRAVQSRLKSKVGKMTHEQCEKVLHAIKGWNL